MKVFGLLLLVCLYSKPLSAEDRWTQFRGPHQDGSTAETGLPHEFNEETNLLWKTPVPGKAWSSPVVWDGKVWLSNATEDGDKLSLVCIDLENGKVLHDQLIFSIESPQFCHPMNSYATPTPVIQGDRIFVHYGSAGTACIDTKTMETVWKRQDLPCDHFRGPASSPTLHEGKLYINFDGFDFQYIVALDEKTGETVWKKDRKIDYGTDNGDAKKAYGTPRAITVGGKTMIVSMAAVATLAYDPDNGDELWTLYHGGMNGSALPLFDKKRLYLNVGYNSGNENLLAVDPTLRGDLKLDQVLWKTKKNTGTRSSQILHEGILYMVSDNGVASALDAETGESIWQNRLEGNYSASPLISEGKIYFFGETGEAPVIATGREFKLLSNNKLEMGFMASPAASQNSLIVRSRTHLYRFGVKK